jgi:hypothetical protein
MVIIIIIIIIIKWLWPHRSPHLNSFEFYLWGVLRNKQHDGVTLTAIRNKTVFSIVPAEFRRTVNVLRKKRVCEMKEQIPTSSLRMVS